MLMKTGHSFRPLRGSYGTHSFLVQLHLRSSVVTGARATYLSRSASANEAGLLVVRLHSARRCIPCWLVTSLPVLFARNNNKKREQPRGSLELELVV